MNINPYPNPQAEPSQSVQSQRPLQQPTFKKALAFFSVASGAMMIYAGITSGLFFFGLFLAVSIGLPGVWWFIHQRREKKGAPPARRHWALITYASIMCFMLSTASLPDTQPNNHTTNSPSSSSSTPATSKKTTTSEESASTTPTAAASTTMAKE